MCIERGPCLKKRGNDSAATAASRKQNSREYKHKLNV